MVPARWAKAKGAWVAEYTFDLAWERERARVGAGELLFDAFTTHVLAEDVGVAEHWECLEVGAGGGSAARWLVDRVGPTGRVLATDVNTHRLPADQGYQVLRHNVATEPVPDGPWDLIHTRMVLLHVPERREVLLEREPDAFVEMIGRYLDTVLDGAPNPSPGEVGRENLQVVLAAYRSAERGQEVLLDEGKPLRVEGRRSPSDRNS